MNEYTETFERILNRDIELYLYWLNSNQLNEVEIIVIYALLAMAED